MSTLRLSFNIILSTCFWGGILYFASGFMPSPKIVEKYIRVSVEKPKPEFSELLKTIPPKYGIGPELVSVLIAKESGGRMDAIRFEPGQMDRARKVSKDPEQQRMYASSICAFQIMGWHAPRLGLKWIDLTDPETCVEVGMKIFRECLDKHAGKERYQQLSGAFLCYNGAEAYARDAMERLSRILVDRMP